MAKKTKVFTTPKLFAIPNDEYDGEYDADDLGVGEYSDNGLTDGEWSICGHTLRRFWDVPIDASAIQFEIKPRPTSQSLRLYLCNGHACFLDFPAVDIINIGTTEVYLMPDTYTLARTLIEESGFQFRRGDLNSIVDVECHYWD